MARDTSILLVGCGAVGTICAVSLERSKKAAVTAILRSQYQAVKDNGFTISSIDHGELTGWKPSHVESSVESGLQHGPFDFVVVTMKSLPDIYSIPSIIAPAITSRVTAIVLIQNGYGIEQPLVDAFPQNTVLSGVSMVGSEQKGTRIVQTDPAVLFLGPFYNGDLVRDEQDAAARRFAEIYNLGGARCTVTEDIVYHRWQKLVWNASFGPVCALSGLDSADVHDAGCLDTLLIPVMNELVSLAAAAGYVLPETIIHDTLHDIPKESRFKPSMLVDALSQRPMEIESTLGNPLQVAESLGVQLPKLTMLYHLLKARAWSFKP